MMKNVCIVCGCKANFFFEKQFDYDVLPIAQYYKCEDCGFMYSRSHYMMDENNWKLLNEAFHTTRWTESSCQENDIGKGQPPYLFQALFLKVLTQAQLIKPTKWVDYGAGWGRFSKICEDFLNIKILSFDKFLPEQEQESSVSYGMLRDEKWQVVYSSALLEHITNIETLDEMISLLAQDGVFIFHTVVCENIPKDKNWFYLKPVHCSFFTNKSLSLLMNKYNFRYCIYCLSAKTWVLFKEKPERVEEIILKINQTLQYEYLLGADNFVDYWKGF